MTSPESAACAVRSLPPIAYVDGAVMVHEIPTEAHAFQVDNFVLRELSGAVLANEAKVNVLAAHGVIDNGRWYTGGSSHLTIPEIVTELEVDGFSTDVIFACTERIAPAGLSRAIVVMNSGQPKVHMRAGHIATGMGVRTIQGQTHLDMAVTSKEDVVYESWLNGRQPKSRVRVVK